ncbi:MAG TPA: tRNA epoxyqueuosine(34) reductase QueG [Bacteroidales bacterium]|nr:tRNA epoxyqueuosine(34) reductase QueG [Bacteroidales bacterium]HRZ49541.1 tRNA epoxyqueuosine(34) reductase QueG [Bacteroidales bacterium]
MQDPDNLAFRIKTLAQSLGFSACGITGTEPMPDAEARFRGWISHGMHAGMRYLEQRISDRFHPATVLQDARSVIVLAYPYGDAATARNNTTGIALYGWGEDYHHRLPRIAAPLMDLLKEYNPGSTSRFYTDSGYLAERSLAVKAGLGWIGKNGTLITPGTGSMLYLAIILTTVQLPFDDPFGHEQCGACKQCLNACPTKALNTSGLVDANRCIAYHTNSSKEPVPQHIAEKLGGRIFGCDICQQVCPHNEKKRITDDLTADFTYPGTWPRTPGEWLALSEEEFRQRFGGSAPAHKGFAKLRANILSAYSPSGDSSAQ